MDVTFTLNTEDLMWMKALEWLGHRRALRSRIALIAAGMLLAPLAASVLMPGLRHAIIGFWLFDLLALAGGIALVVTLARRFFGALLLDIPVGGQQTLSVGPACLLETTDESVAVPWEYVRSVSQDPRMVIITLASGARYTIPRRAFASQFDSLRFGFAAWRYCRQARRASRDAPAAL